ncbi:MAG: ATP-binding cassette domain-containing protein, partial [Clostridiaceae bacterium]
LAMSIFGKSFGKRISGTIIKDGKEIHLNSVRKAIDSGLAYCTEDRKSSGLVLNQHIMGNISLANLKKISKNKFVDDNKDIQVAEEYRKKLNIKSSSSYQKCGNLSGGNQQKVVLSKWIFTDPEVLMLDEPTRGIDVGAKYEIYTIIQKLADQGKAIMFISSELPEILGICNRIYVMNEGKIVGELSSEEASQESIMKCIMQCNMEGK